MSLRAAPIAREFVNGLTDCVKGSPHPSTPCALCAACVRVTRLSTTLQAYPRCRVPAAPLAGALLISISAVSVSCCAHLSAPDVWQLVVLGAAASPLVTLRGCACCRLLRRARTAGCCFSKRMRKVPSFCCQPLGGSDLGVSRHQVRAVIGSSWFLLCLRQSPLGSSASISSRCRNHVSPIRCGTAGNSRP